MKPRVWAFIVFALSLGAGCVTLGFWQLSRLAARRAANADLVQQRSATAMPFGELVGSPASLRFRRVQLTGTYDFTKELVLTSRSRDGSPGVHFLTPLRQAAGVPLVLINRGWVYAADGMIADSVRWREEGTVLVDGYIETFVQGSGAVATSSVRNGVRRLEFDSIAARVGEPLAALLVVQQAAAEAPIVAGRATTSPEAPIRIAPPKLSDGSHRGYAIQWFAFAAIAVIGVGAVVIRERARNG